MSFLKLKFSNGAETPASGSTAEIERRLSAWPLGLQLGVFFAVYLLSALLSRLAFSPERGPYVSFWLPAGVFIATLLHVPTRRWPPFLGAAFAANVLFMVFDSVSLGRIVYFALTNVVEALVSTGLARAFLKGGVEPDSRGRTFLFLAYCVGAGPLLGGCVRGLFSSFMSLDGDWTSLLLIWWAGHTLGALIVVPFFLSWRESWRDWYRASISPSKVESLSILIILLGAVVLNYGILMPQGLHAKFVVVPILLWVGFRFGVRGVVVAGGLATFLTFVLTGNGPLQGQGPDLSSIALVQLTNIVMVTTCLCAAIAWSQSRRRLARFDSLQASITEAAAVCETRTGADGLPEDFRIEEANSAFASLFGTRGAPLEGRWLREWIGEEPPYLDRVRELFRSKVPVVFDAALEGRHFKVSIFLPGERNRFALIAADLTQEKRREAEILRLNRCYRLLSEINHLVARARDREELLKAAVAAFVEAGGVREACVALAGADGRLVLLAEKHAYESAGEAAKNPAERPAPALLRTCMEQGGLVFDRCLEANAAGAPSLAAAFPLWQDGVRIGAFGVLFDEAGAPGDLERTMLATAGDDISYGLDNLAHEQARVQALSNLRESELRFRQLFEEAPVPYLTLDREARIADTNPAWERLFGAESKGGLGRPFFEFVQPKGRGVFADSYRQLVERKGERSFEMELCRVDGAPLSAIVNVRVEADLKGAFRTAHCVVFDITERRRFEAALLSSEKRLMLAFEVANDGIWDMDLRTGEVYLTHRYYTMLGYAYGEFPRGFEHWSALMHPDDFTRVDTAFKGFLRSNEEEFRSEHRLRAKDGSWRWMLCRGRVAERSPEGRTLRVIGTNSDITERRQAEQALVDTSRRYRSYIHESPLAILAVDGAGNVQEANPSACALFGRNEIELLALSLGQFLDASSSDAAKRLLAQLAQSGKGEAELCARRKNGALLYLAVVASSVGTERSILFCQDVTARRRAEQLLQSRESMLESILHTALDGFWVLDREGRLLEVNRSYCTLVGYSHKELLQMRMLDLDAIENAVSLQRHLERIVTAGQDRWETRHKRKDGTLVEVEMSATYIPQEGGRLVVFVQDIGERKRAETELRQSQKRLALIIEGSALAAWDWNISSGEVVFNGYWSSLFGYGKAEKAMPIASWRALQHPDDAPRVADALALHLTGKTAYFDCEYRIRHSDGSWLWVLDRGQVIARDSQGRPLRATGTQRDVTARHLAEDGMRRQAALLDQTRDLVFVADAQGVLSYCNRSAERLLGIPAAQLEGRRLAEVLPDACPNLDEGLLRVVLAEGEWHGEISFATGPRQGCCWDSRWCAIPSADGAARQVLVVSTDVSEKRQLEARFLRAQRMESIGALASGVAHDLNNIFLPITLVANMLRQKPDAGQQDSLFAMLDQSAQRGADIVRQLLAFGRGLDGRHIEMQPTSLFHEMRKIVRETFPKNISIECRLPEDLWTVRADPTQLHQVLLNLCVNARDAMPAGGRITLAAENVYFDEHYAELNPDAQAGPYIVLEAGDTGVGMTPEVMEKIFDPFFTTKEPGKGTGLGLSTVHGIVKSHGGFVQVLSHPGEGTLFKVYLPAIPNATEVCEEPADVDLPQGNGETILVVDDEDAVRDTLRHMLQGHGYRVLVASDGRQGMGCFVQQREAVRAIVTDIMMPVMDGVEFIKAVRSIDPTVPVIAMSGLPEKEAIAEREGAKADHFLAKPFVSYQLLALLHAKLQSVEETVSSDAVAAASAETPGT